MGKLWVIPQLYIGFKGVPLTNNIHVLICITIKYGGSVTLQACASFLVSKYAIFTPHIESLLREKNIQFSP